jgi:hypothetical protein
MSVAPLMWRARPFCPYTHSIIEFRSTHTGVHACQPRSKDAPAPLLAVNATRSPAAARVWPLLLFHNPSQVLMLWQLGPNSQLLPKTPVPSQLQPQFPSMVVVAPPFLQTLPPVLSNAHGSGISQLLPLKPVP